VPPTAAATDWSWLIWVVVALGVVLALFVWIVVRKGRPLPGANVFHASRWSKGNRLLPAQVAITAESVTLYKPQWIGKIEESIHMAHVSSIKIDTNLMFSTVFIESTGGHNPIVCQGHTKGDAVKMKKLIEQYQSVRYGR
jgi:hypothetical protein